MSRLLAAEGGGSLAAAGCMLEAELLVRAGQACLCFCGLESVQGRAADAPFCCTVSGRCACALDTHPATVGQLNGGGCFASDHLLSPQVQALSCLYRVTDSQSADSAQKTPVPGVFRAQS